MATAKALSSSAVRKWRWRRLRRPFFLSVSHTSRVSPQTLDIDVYYLLPSPASEPSDRSYFPGSPSWSVGVWIIRFSFLSFVNENTRLILGIMTSLLVLYDWLPFRVIVALASDARSPLLCRWVDYYRIRMSFALDFVAPWARCRALANSAWMLMKFNWVMKVIIHLRTCTIILVDELEFGSQLHNFLVYFLFFRARNCIQHKIFIQISPPIYRNY